MFVHRADFLFLSSKAVIILICDVLLFRNPVNGRQKNDVIQKVEMINGGGGGGGCGGCEIYILCISLLFFISKKSPYVQIQQKSL